MKKKFKFGAIALVMGIAMSSQSFAVKYEPNIDPDIKIDKIEALDEYEYTEADVNRILEIYMNGENVSQEELKKYDLNEDGKLTANDAAMVYDIIG